MRIDNIENFIDKICNEIKYNSVKKNISDEIRNHINEENESYLENGIAENIALEKTISNMGDPKLIGQKLNNIHRPKLEFKLLITSIIILLFGIIVSYSLSKTIYKYDLGADSWFNKNIIYIIFSAIIGIIIYFCDYTKLKNKSFYIFLITTIIGITLTILSKQYINIINGIDTTFLNTQMFITDLLLPLYIISFAGFINIYNLKIKKDIINISLISVISFITIGLCSNGIYLLIMLLAYMVIVFIKIFKGNEYTKKYKKITFMVFLLIGFISLMIYFLFYSSNSNIYRSTYMLDIRENILKNSQFIGENKLEGNLNNEITLSDWAYGLQDAERTEIFTYIIGKYGYLLGLILFISILYLSIRFITNIKKIKDSYGKYIIIGFATMIILQSIFHILSNMCYIPANSSVLPLVSYSNFNMVFNIILLSMILSIYRRKDIINYT